MRVCITHYGGDGEGMVTDEDELWREEAEYERHSRNRRPKICYGGGGLKFGFIFEGGESI